MSTARKTRILRKRKKGFMLLPMKNPRPRLQTMKMYILASHVPLRYSHADMYLQDTFEDANDATPAAEAPATSPTLTSTPAAEEPVTSPTRTARSLTQRRPSSTKSISQVKDDEVPPMPAAFPVEDEQTEEADAETASQPKSPLLTSRRPSTTPSLDNVDLEDPSPLQSTADTPDGMLSIGCVYLQCQRISMLITRL